MSRRGVLPLLTRLRTRLGRPRSACVDPIPIAPPKESFSLIPLLTLASGMHGPATVPTDSAPEELFVVQNMGNFVPPFEPDAGYHGTSAAIEFAVLSLGVSDMVVCGHSHCGAIQALYTPPSPATPHISSWLDLARAAMLPEAPGQEVLRRTEKRSIVLQLERLMGYPMVRERVDQGNLCLHAWYYVIEEGTVSLLDVTSGQFVAVSD